jgi:hypothetical protein
VDNDELAATRVAGRPERGGRPRRWRVISLAVVASAALAGCGSASPASQSAGRTAAPLSVATATMPPSATVTPKPAHSTPKPTSPTAAHSTPAATATHHSQPATGSSAANGGGTTGGGAAACVTSGAKDSCGPYSYPQIQGTAANPIVGNDVWAPVNGWQQTLYANSPGDFRVTANMPAGNTAVISYPSNAANYGEKKISTFSSIYSSFSEKMNATGSTSAWAAYDIWLNNWTNEIMIQHDVAGGGPCPTKATATFGGKGGVPVRTWNLCQYGTELIWKLTGGSVQSGSVDVLAMLNWLAGHGYYSPTSTLTDISYGWELCSTGGRPETFTISGYSVTAK